MENQNPNINPNENNNQNNVNVTVVNNVTGYSGYGVPVNKWLYIVVVFLLGWIGGHKFMTGNVMGGVVYLLFCWTTIPAILSFFTLLSALVKAPDAQGNIFVKP